MRGREKITEIFFFYFPNLVIYFCHFPCLFAPVFPPELSLSAAVIDIVYTLIYTTAAVCVLHATTRHIAVSNPCVFSLSFSASPIDGWARGEGGGRLGIYPGSVSEGSCL